MIIYIDESGVHRPTGKSVFAIINIKDDEVKYIENAVVTIEKNLNIQPFHWADSAWPIKIKFFTRILELPFTFSIEIFNNPIEQEKKLEIVIRKNFNVEMVNSVYIDGAKPRWYVSQVKKALRDLGIPILMIQMVSDEHSAGLRLADLVAGLTRRYIDGSPKTELLKMYKKLLKKQNPQ